MIRQKPVIFTAPQFEYMLFNSLAFLAFFPLVFLIYWFVLQKNHRYQNVFLMVASYYFYACWDWRFMFLLLFSTVLDYFSAIQIENTTSESKRKFWFVLSIGINAGFLGVFKYYDFFATSFSELLNGMGISVHATTLNLILPVGISFYTFHGLSYVIDVYQKKLRAVRDFPDYSLFVAFFPLLVAGPIERAHHLLPQVRAPRHFDLHNAVLGMRQILWGFFKKVVIADNCAVIANQVFENADQFNSLSLAIGAVCFAFQIYGDFSGYSDIALGTARLMGFELLQNFSFPYFSRNIAEFWRRWHISLSSWFRDYVYIPLGGSRVSKSKQVRNTFIIFLLSGFWHGANWTFIMWGLLNALYFIPLLLINKNRSHLNVVAEHSALPTIKEFMQVITTFGLTVVAWVFFRATSIQDAFHYLMKLFTFNRSGEMVKFQYFTFLLLAFFILIEWAGRRNRFAIETMLAKKPTWIRWSFYSLILIVMGLFMQTKETPFIYFQF